MTEDGRDAGSGRFESMGKRVDEGFSGVIPRVEEELKKVIRYLDDEVVPQVRLNSSQALRGAAEQLRKLAERLDDSRPGGPSGGKG